MINLEKLAEYKRCGNHVTQQICQIAAILEKHLPDPFKFAHNGVAFVSNLQTSNVGSYGAAICYAEGDYPDANLYPVDENFSVAGQFYYLHRDFHSGVHNASRTKIMHVAENLPGFLRELETSIEKATKKLAVSKQILHSMIDAAERMEKEIESRKEAESE